MLHSDAFLYKNVISKGGGVYFKEQKLLIYPTTPINRKQSRQVVEFRRDYDNLFGLRRMPQILYLLNTPGSCSHVSNDEIAIDLHNRF